MLPMLPAFWAPRGQALTFSYLRPLPRGFWPPPAAPQPAVSGSSGSSRQLHARHLGSPTWLHAAACAPVRSAGFSPYRGSREPRATSAEPGREEALSALARSSPLEAQSFYGLKAALRARQAGEEWTIGNPGIQERAMTTALRWPRIPAFLIAHLLGHAQVMPERQPMPQWRDGLDETLDNRKEVA